MKNKILISRIIGIVLLFECIAWGLVLFCTTNPAQNPPKDSFGEIVVYCHLGILVLFGGIGVLIGGIALLVNSFEKNKELDTHRFISIPIERPIKTVSYRMDITRDFYESDLCKESSIKGIICDGILRELIKRDSVRIAELTSSHSDIVTFEGTLEYLEPTN